MFLSNIIGDDRQPVSPAIQTAALSHHLTMTSTLKMQTLNKNFLSEVERLANVQKEECIILNDRIAKLECSLITCKSYLSESERLRQEEKCLADQKESLLQQNICSAYQMMSDLQKNMNTIVIKSTEEKIVTCQQVAELQAQKLIAKQKAQLQQEELNLVNQQIAELRAQKLAHEQKEQSQAQEINFVKEQLAVIQVQKKAEEQKVHIQQEELNFANQQISRLQTQKLAEEQKVESLRNDLRDANERIVLDKTELENILPYYVELIHCNNMRPAQEEEGRRIKAARRQQREIQFYKLQNSIEGVKFVFI